MRRRNLLGAVAALAPAPAIAQASAPASPDTALLALCERHATVTHLIRAMDAGAPHTDDDMDAAMAEQVELAERIGAICPATLPGLAAKARAVVDHSTGYLCPDEPRNSHDRLTDALIADLIAMGGAA